MKNILIVDDDPLLCETLSIFLKELGANKVMAFSSLKELQNANFDANHYELAILDVNLGAEQPDGIDVHTWLNNNSFYGKFVFFTGHGSSHPLVKKACLVQNVELIEKPNGIDRLAELVKRFP